MRYTKEIELIDAFCHFLERNGCEYKRELRKGSYHGEGYIDVVIKKNNKFVGVEAKLKGFQSVLYQASSLVVRCDYAYILYPRRLSKKNAKKCEEYGVGLIVPKSEFEFEYLLKARLSRFSDHGTPIITRNWNENRCGRIIHPKELPENYNLNNIDKLKPDYKWVKRYQEKGLRLDGHDLKTKRKEQIKFKTISEFL